MALTPATFFIILGIGVLIGCIALLVWAAMGPDDD